MKFLFFTLSISFLFSFPYSVTEIISVYKDEELIALWNSLENFYNPTVNDYAKIKQYINFGERPYIKELLSHISREKIEIKSAHLFKTVLLQEMGFVGVNGELPLFETTALGDACLEEKKRCIIFYTPYGVMNKSIEIMQSIKALEETGYQGHVLYRVGGYPLVERGGLHLVHVPYSFKLLLLIEASLLGYEEVLFLDPLLQPIDDLSSVFSKISTKGVYLLEKEMSLGYDHYIGKISMQAMCSSDVEEKDLWSIPHMSAKVIGVSFQKKRGHAFINEWYRLTSFTYPAMTLFPEEFVLSIAAWKVEVHSSNYLGGDVAFSTDETIEDGKSFKWLEKSDI